MDQCRIDEWHIHNNHDGKVPLHSLCQMWSMITGEHQSDVAELIKYALWDESEAVIYNGINIPKDFDEAEEDVVDEHVLALCSFELDNPESVTDSPSSSCLIDLEKLASVFDRNGHTLPKAFRRHPQKKTKQDLPTETTEYTTCLIQLAAEVHTRMWKSEDWQDFVNKGQSGREKYIVDEFLVKKKSKGTFDYYLPGTNFKVSARAVTSIHNLAIPDDGLPKIYKSSHKL